MLLSADACDLCRKIATECKAVHVGQAFAVIGENAHYRDVEHPPLHPNCQCALTEILLPAYGGPKPHDVPWGETLEQPQRDLTGGKPYTPPAGKTVPEPEPKKLGKPVTAPEPEPRPEPEPPIEIPPPPGLPPAGPSEPIPPKPTSKPKPVPTPPAPLPPLTPKAPLAFTPPSPKLPPVLPPEAVPGPKGRAVSKSLEVKTSKLQDPINDALVRSTAYTETVLCRRSRSTEVRIRPLRENTGARKTTFP